MKVFGYELNLKKSNIEKNNYVNSLISKYPNLYLGNNIGSLGEYVVDKYTPFKILKQNVISSSALRLLSNKIGKYGFELVNSDGEVIEDKEIYMKSNQIFSIPTLHSLVFQYLQSVIGAGQVFSTINKINGVGEILSDSKLKILDPRSMNITQDGYGDVLGYNYYGKERYTDTILVDHLVYPDLDRPAYGLSMLNSVIIDGLTDLATSDKQFHFFRNNAMPNVVYLTHEGSITSQEQKEEFERKINERYAGVSNNSKPMASSVIKDVKVIELSHKDLELLKQRLFIHNEFGITFGFDLRLLSYMRDGGSYSEIDSITLKQANSQITTYAKIVEDGMKLCYEKFIDKTPYSYRLKNEYYRDEIKEKQVGLREIELGATSRNEYRTKFGMVKVEDETMDEYIINTGKIIPLLNDNLNNTGTI